MNKHWHNPTAFYACHQLNALLSDHLMSKKPHLGMPHPFLTHLQLRRNSARRNTTLPPFTSPPCCDDSSFIPASSRAAGAILPGEGELWRCSPKIRWPRALRRGTWEDFKTSSRQGVIALRLLRACTHALGCCLRSLQGTQEFLKRRHIFTAERLKKQGSGIFIYLFFIFFLRHAYSIDSGKCGKLDLSPQLKIT